VRDVAKNQRLPVVLFCAGGISTPADAALTMQLGAEGNFVGSGIYKSGDPARFAKAIVEAVTHLRAITSAIKALAELKDTGLDAKAEEYRVPVELVRDVAEHQRLPVVLFCAGGISTPADAALTMQLGAEGNFVGSGIYKSGDPARFAKAIVEATTHFRDAKLIGEVSRGLGEPMRGITLETIPAGERLAVRGW
jgi:pyridoxal 5'-phosphate synthase pdxS subunit